MRPRYSSNLSHVFEQRAINILIFLTFAYLLIPTIFGQLSVDDIYFLKCAYNLANNTAPYEFDLCYEFSFYDWLLIPFLKEPYWVQGVIIFKYLNYFLLLAIPFLYFYIVDRKFFLHQKVGAVLLSCTFILYIASQRTIEIRPETFASIAFFLGAVIIISSRIYNIKTYLLSLILLCVAAFLSPRYLLFSGSFILYAIYHIHNTREKFKDTYFVILPSIFAFALLSYTTIDFLLTAKYFNSASHAQTHAAQITNTPKLETLFLWKVKLGLSRVASLHNSYLGTFFLIVKLTLFTASIATSLYLLIKILRKKIKKETIFLLALPWLWLLILITERIPFGYILIIELTVLSIFWIAIFQQKLLTFPAIRNTFAYFTWYLLLISIAIGANISNNNYKQLEYFSKVDSTSINRVETPVLTSYLYSNNFKTQLLARQEICKRYPTVATLLSFYAHLICKENFNNFSGFFPQDYRDPNNEFSQQPISIVDFQGRNVIKDPQYNPSTITSNGNVLFYTKGIDLGLGNQ